MCDNIVGFFPAMLCTLILGSCVGIDGKVPPSRYETVRMTTRASLSGAAPEDRVIGLEAMAFIQETGLLEDYGRSSGLEVALDVRRNEEYDCVLCANLPEGSLSGVWNRDSYKRAISYFQDNGSSSFIMSGERDGLSLPEKGGTAVELTRLASKITLGVVDPVFVTSEIAALGVIFERAFLINVTGECLLHGTPSAGSWRNCLEMEDSLSLFESEAYCREFGLQVLGHSDINAGAVFYCYPNPIDNGIDSSTAPEWSPRNTRLVLEFSVRGVKNYYPITLPAMECNAEYVIDRVRLVGGGADKPDLAVSRKGIEYGVTVIPWEPNNLSPVWQ